jgi:D-alanyl-D-alanine endopeptidase (penicillin-binding protein 7)
MRFLTSIALSLVFLSVQAKEITATSWLVANEQGTVIKGENTNEVHPIASISKLMTVMVVMDAHQLLDEKLGKYTREQLIQLALVKSDNIAAETLCNNYPMGRDFCVKAMNEKAQALYMNHTHYIEPTGLSVFNVSTAEDLVNLVMAASKYAIINDAAHTSTAKIKIKKRWLIFRNTNPIVGYNQNVIVSKTGYIRASGGCLVMMLDTEVGKRIIVLLGSKNTHTRIPEAEIIIKNID